MVYLARKGAGVVAHTDVQAMMDLDGVSPEMTISDEEWSDAEGLVRLIGGQIVLGKTEAEKELEDHIKSLKSEEAELLAELADKDYVIIKTAERGGTVSDEYPALHERREWCRTRIEDIRHELDKVNGIE